MKINNIKKLVFIAVVVLFSSCSELKNITEEQYKKIVYALSYDNSNVYEAIHNLSQSIDTGYVSVCVSGTKHITEDISVTFVEDREAFDRYNVLNFDLDTSKYAVLLDKKFYNIPSLSVTVPKEDNIDNGLLPIIIKPNGLSPDSTYFISLKITDASGYEINEKRQSVLYRIYIENAYAQQKERTTYFMKGERKREADSEPIPISSSKRVFPISGSAIRTYVDTYGHQNNLTRINGFSMIVNINDDRTIDFSPYKPELIQIEKIDDEKSNYYYEEKDARGDLQKRIKLHYRYRIINTETNEWSGWTEMVENLKRQN
jgi:Domain of unknown function (DUF1735).